MMTSYFYSFLKNNKVKVVILVLSLGVYFSLAVVALTLNRSIPEIASIPLKSIGVQTVVQKSGRIPSKMLGAVFPHSNGPITDSEFASLEELPFVETADKGLYFWYFDKLYFKALLGVRKNSAVFVDILKRNVVEGEFALGWHEVLVTEGFARKNSLSLGDSINISEDSYAIRGILKTSLSGNIFPADIYMSMADAEAIVVNSKEIKNTYEINDKPFSNVVLLRTDPGWSGDKNAAIKKIDADFLVFSEKSFSAEILDQLKIISLSGRMMFAVLGLVLTVAFITMIMFNLKTREKEVAILRILGWKIRDLKGQFIGESFVILLAALLLGNFFAFVGIWVLQSQTVSMELPWDISARPHFLPEENAIERIVTSNIPIHYEPTLVFAASLAFVLIFLIISFVAFIRIGKIKPYLYQK